MSAFKKNIAANLAGSAYTSILTLALLPVLIRLLGMEAYGLIGFFSTLQISILLFDLGLGATLTKELARLLPAPGKEQEIRNLVRSLEAVCILAAMALIALVFFLAAPITDHWIHFSGLARQEVIAAFRVMAATLGVQLLYNFYAGGISGLQRQVALNGWNVFFLTVQNVGGILFLWFFSPPIHLFLVWNLAIFFLQTLCIRQFFVSRLPDAPQPVRIDARVYRETFHFAAGNSSYMFMSTIVVQADKIILGKLLPLEILGYYTFAWTAAISLSKIVNPFYAAFYPRMAEMLAHENQERVGRFYHLGSQLVAALIIPPAVVLMFFSEEIIRLWTHNEVLTQNAAALTSLLVAGRMLNGLIHVPLAFQLASGWTSLAVVINLASLIVFPPMLWVSCRRLGVDGAALSWLVLNGAYLIAYVVPMHRRLLPGQAGRWYVDAVAKPFLAALLVVGTARLLYPAGFSIPLRLIFLMAAGGVTLGAAAAAAPLVREELLVRARLLFKKRWAVER